MTAIFIEAPQLAGKPRIRHAFFTRQGGVSEGIYASLEQVKRPRIRELLKQHEADARISQRLVTFRLDAPITFDLDTLRQFPGSGRRVRCGHRNCASSGPVRAARR